MRLVFVGIILVAASGAAQERPNFSGTWTAQIDASQRPVPVAAYGPEFTLDHKDRTLAVRRLFGGLPTTILVDEAGCQIGVMEGPAEWDSPDAMRLIEAAVGNRKEQAASLPPTTIHSQ